jgi:hypothetical protein
MPSARYLSLAIDRPRLAARADRRMPIVFDPEVARLEHRDVRFLRLVNRAVVLRVLDREQQRRRCAIAAEPVPQAAHRLLLRIRSPRCAA